MTTTTLKLAPELKRRISRLARESGKTAHAFMVQALEREATREERMRQFVREAMASDAAAEAGAPVYRADDVYAWMERRARGERIRELVISIGKTGYLAMYSLRPQRDEVRVLAVRHQRELDYPA